MDALTKIILGALANTSVGVLDVNVFAGAMTACEFAMSGPLEEVSC